MCATARPWLPSVAVTRRSPDEAAARRREARSAPTPVRSETTRAVAQERPGP